MSSNDKGMIHIYFLRPYKPDNKVADVHHEAERIFETVSLILDQAGSDALAGAQQHVLDALPHDVRRPTR